MSNRIDQVRLAAEVTGRAYADECVKAAFELVRPAIELLWPTYPAEGRLVINQDCDDNGDTRVLLLAVRGDGDELLWYRDVYERHPDALAAANRTKLDLNEVLISRVEEMLQIAYDQPGRGVFSTTGTDDYRGLPRYQSWNILDVEQPRHGAVARTVLVEGVDGDEYQFALGADDCVILHVDGVPFVGVIGDDGPGWWPDGDGDDWQPLRLGAKVVERSMRVLGISETQFFGLSERLHLPRGHFGRFKGWPDELHDINLYDRSWSCGDRFDAALAYVEELGLTYDLTVETKYERRPQPPGDPVAGHPGSEPIVIGHVGDPARCWAAAYNRFEAASIIRESYPNATRVEFAKPGWHRHFRASVWTLYAGEQDIWASHDEHSDQMLRQDLITERLADAHELDPAAFKPPKGCVSGLTMDLDEELAAVTVEATERVTDHMVRLVLGFVEVAELVGAVTGSAPDGDAPSGRSRLRQFAAALVGALGERGAWARLDELAARRAGPVAE